MILAGTSGYNYDAWKGRFYPEDLSASKMLRFYAGHFPTVEINYTFRRMPTEKALQTWASQVPENFRFALKAPFWVVNQKKPAQSVRALAPFLKVTSLLEARRGPILFQFAPNLKREPARLQPLLDALPKDVMAAFEFQEPSWFHDDTYAALAKAEVALCIVDDEEGRTPVEKTASFGYLRLRREDYDKRAITRWRKRIDALKLSEAFVYFRHEDTASGPRFAKMLLQTG